MGYMTEISISNDAWGEFKKMILERPGEFVNEIQTLMNGRPIYERDETGKDHYVESLCSDEIFLPGHAGYSTVYKSHHADEPVLYLAWRGSFRALDQFRMKEEYGAKMENPDNHHVLDVLEKEVLEAERILQETKKYLKEIRTKQEKAQSDETKA